MRSSKIQALIISLILRFLYNSLDLKEYLILTDEIGFSYAPGSLRTLDIVIFEREKFLENEINEEFVKTP